MSSWQNTATASESLYVPVGAAAATTEPAPTRALRVRVVGATAIALAASVAIQNAVVISAGTPSYADPINKVLAFHAEHRVAVEIAVAPTTHVRSARVWVGSVVAAAALTGACRDSCAVAVLRGDLISYSFVAVG